VPHLDQRPIDSQPREPRIDTTTTTWADRAGCREDEEGQDLDASLPEFGTPDMSIGLAAEVL